MDRRACSSPSRAPRRSSPARWDEGSCCRAEVAVDDRVGSLRGQRGRRGRRAARQAPAGRGLRRLPLLRPPAQLALHEAGRATELGQADVGGVDVWRSARTSTSASPILRRSVRRFRVTGRKRVAADVADDALHHVERRAERTVGVAEVKRARDRHGRSRPSAVMTRYSRPMSCAVGRMWPSGGRRRITSPASQATR